MRLAWRRPNNRKSQSTSGAGHRLTAQTAGSGHLYSVGDLEDPGNNHEASCQIENRAFSGEQAGNVATGGKIDGRKAGGDTGRNSDGSEGNSSQRRVCLGPNRMTDPYTCCNGDPKWKHKGGCGTGQHYLMAR